MREKLSSFSLKVSGNKNILVLSSDIKSALLFLERSAMQYHIHICITLHISNGNSEVCMDRMTELCLWLKQYVTRNH